MPETFLQGMGKKLLALWRGWRHEKILLDNDVPLTVVYVDPRYKITLTNDQHKRGKNEWKNMTNETQEQTKRIKVKSLTSDSDNEYYDKHLDQQEKTPRNRKRINDWWTVPAGTFQNEFYLCVKW